MSFLVSYSQTSLNTSDISYKYVETASPIAPISLTGTVKDAQGAPHTTSSYLLHYSTFAFPPRFLLVPSQTTYLTADQNSHALHLSPLIQGERSLIGGNNLFHY